jgi:hypothetical protein
MNDARMTWMLVSSSAVTLPLHWNYTEQQSPCLMLSHITQSSNHPVWCCLTLHRAAIALFDADSHFFPKQKNSCSHISLNVCTTLHNIYTRMLCYYRTNEEENLREIGLNLTSNIDLQRLENLCPTRNWNKKCGARRSEEKCYWFRKLRLEFCCL